MPRISFSDFLFVYVLAIVNEVLAFSFAFMVAVEDASSLVWADWEALSYLFQGEESIWTRRNRSTYKVSVVTIPIVNPISSFWKLSLSTRYPVSDTSNLKREKCEIKNTSPMERKTQPTNNQNSKKLKQTMSFFYLDFFLYSGLGL